MVQAWMKEWLPILSNLIIALSSALVAAFAIWGVSRWRKEMTGKSKYEIARKMMVAAHRFREHFRWARNPGGWGWEWAERQRQDSESPEQRRILDNWYARTRRLELPREDLLALQEAGWEAQTVIGEDASQLVKQFRVCFAELSSAIDALFDAEYTHIGDTSWLSREHDWLTELRHIMNGLENDDLSKKVDDLIQELSKRLKNHLK